MSTTTSDITAAEWLDVRDAVASEVKRGSSMQQNTAINVAERLLRCGFIDIDAVLTSIRPKPATDQGEEAPE